MADHTLRLCKNLIDWFGSVSHERACAPAGLSSCCFGRSASGINFSYDLTISSYDRSVAPFTDIQPCVHRRQLRQRQRDRWLVDGTASGFLCHWFPSRRNLQPRSSSGKHGIQQYTPGHSPQFQTQEMLPFGQNREPRLAPYDTSDLLAAPCRHAQEVHQGLVHARPTYPCGKHDRADTGPYRLRPELYFAQLHRK